MFSLIFYCGLISSVVSAHFNNDTSHDGDELDINTTLSTLASTKIPVSKDCVLEMKGNEISQIVELFNSNFVNVVVIHISFSNRSHEGQLFSDFHVSLSNRVGRQILIALKTFRACQWTLKAGIRNFKLNVKGSQNDCIKKGKNATDFVLESTQHIVDSINLTTNNQVCSSFKDTSSGEVKQTCCQITKPNLATKFNYKCPRGNSFLFGNNSLENVIAIIMYLLTSFYFMWLSLVLVSRSEFDLKYPEYYKLEESMISPCSILLKVFWDENGLMVSFIRSLVLVLGFISFFLMGYVESLSARYLFMFGISLSCLQSFSTLFKSRNTNSSLILDEIKKRRNNVFQRFVRYYHNRDPLWEKGKRGDFEVVVKIILSPFNPNVWRNLINKPYNACIRFTSFVPEWFSNRILKTLARYTCLVFAVLTSFIYACFFFCVLIVLATTYPIVILWNFFALVFRLRKRKCGFCYHFLFFLHTLGLLLLLLLSVLKTMLVIMPFLLGLFLNLAYLIPYFAFFSVLTFYCCTYWKTMEEQYFVLKRLIYEACRETQNINNGCIPNRHPEPNEKVLPVVSKELYDKIREELLPYDTNLFYFGLKMLWSIAFSLGFLALMLLNELDDTGLVQVVTTASLGVLPHIFNMVGLKTSEERKKAESEKLKSNVKFMVKELIGKDPKLARRLLIIEQDDDVIEENNYTATNDENAEDSEHFEIMFGIDCPDNGEIGSARTVTPGGNDETTDENGQNSKNAYDNVDSEDGQLDEMVHRNREAFIDDDDGHIIDSEEQSLVQQNNEVIVEENHQSSGNAYDNVDSDDGKLVVIVHRNTEAMIEDSKEEPLLQQNNDVMVEENCQNSGNTDDSVNGDGGKLAVIVHRNREALIGDIEDPEEQPLVQQNNDVTVEENHQNSGNTHDNVDGDDGQLAVTVHRIRKTMINDIEDSEKQSLVPLNSDTIVEENHKNSGNTHDNVDSDDGKLAVIVHRNHKTMIDDIEDSEKQPLAQQNNDVTIKENDQNSVFEYCK